MRLGGGSGSTWLSLARRVESGRCTDGHAPAILVGEAPSARQTMPPGVDGDSPAAIAPLDVLAARLAARPCERVILGSAPALIISTGGVLGGMLPCSVSWGGVLSSSLRANGARRYRGATAAVSILPAIVSPPSAALLDIVSLTAAASTAAAATKDPPMAPAPSMSPSDEPWHGAGSVAGCGAARMNVFGSPLNP